ncbi:MAG: ferrous iron transport protein B [Deltaproteobacteria bacterium]|nr:ferrous iron transport protein B [Deltaproteobacteria bacterium]
MTAITTTELGRTTATVVVIGNPNTGKSTIFTALTGVRQKVANYPGVTVEKRSGHLSLDGMEVELVDLPGTYSLAAHSPDEMVAVDVLFGGLEGMEHPDAVLVVVDASNLRRNLYLASQVLELGVPVVVALNMVDVAKARGIEIDAEALAARIRATVVPMVASHDQGLDELRAALAKACRGQLTAPSVHVLPELFAEAERIAASEGERGHPVKRYEVERGLIDAGAFAETRLIERAGASLRAELEATRARLGSGRPLAALEAQRRYGWIAAQLDGVEKRSEPRRTWTDRIDAVITHKVWGSLVFVLVMGAVFQSVFRWATPVMDAIDGAFKSLGTAVGDALPPGALASLVTDGVIAGVGSVLVFLPQILILFLFIGVLEDSGYMSRAAFLMDRVMRFAGLSGQSFIPMLSSFACAVPGIMATRVIADRRDRLTTILVAPLMTCSARLPIYTVLIAAFIPHRHFAGGWLGLQGLVMLSLYLLGIVLAVIAASIFKRTVLKGPTPTFLMELPAYKWPRPRAMVLRLVERAKVFVLRAGTVIFSVSVVVWALSYFPRPASIHERFENERAEVTASASGEARDTALASLAAAEDAAYLEQSVFGRMGHVIEPVFRPLGWAWRVAMAAIASFPAREVVISVLGTTYALGKDVDEGSDTLRSALQGARWPDGKPVFTAATALGLMVFFALCLQCVATVATIRRETQSWKWPAFAWTYMTVLAYVGALLTYQIGTRLMAG